MFKLSRLGSCWNNYLTFLSNFAACMRPRLHPELLLLILVIILEREMQLHYSGLWRELMQYWDVPAHAYPRGIWNKFSKFSCMKILKRFSLPCPWLSKRHLVFTKCHVPWQCLPSIIVFMTERQENQQIIVCTLAVHLSRGLDFILFTSAQAVLLCVDFVSNSKIFVRNEFR